MHVRLKGINHKRKRLADGSFKDYYWAWKGKGAPLLPGKPGSPEFVSGFNAAVARLAAERAPGDTLLALLNRFQQSGEFKHKLNDRTRRDYIKNIKRIETEFADFPLKALDDRRARAEFLDWRDRLAEKSLRQADYTYQTLRRVLSWAKDRGIIDSNPCAETVNLYSGSRVDKIWSDEEIDRFLAVASPPIRLLMHLALETGQRRGDLLKLTWTAYDGATIRVRQSKTGKPVPVPVSDRLKVELDAAPRRSPVIALNASGRPWTANGLQSVWRDTAIRAGIEDRTFHDLRGTAVVRLARAGCTIGEIYSITGHKPGDSQAILTAHYLPRDGEVAGNAIAKLNAYRRDQNGDEKFPSALPSVASNKGK